METALESPLWVFEASVRAGPRAPPGRRDRPGTRLLRPGVTGCFVNREKLSPAAVTPQDIKALYAFCWDVGATIPSLKASKAETVVEEELRCPECGSEHLARAGAPRSFSTGAMGLTTVIPSANRDARGNAIPLKEREKFYRIRKLQRHSSHSRPGERSLPETLRSVDRVTALLGRPRPRKASARGAGVSEVPLRNRFRFRDEKYMDKLVLPRGRVPRTPPRSGVV